MAEPSPSDDGTMTFLEHLDELRSRLIRVAIAFVVAFAVCWAFSDDILELLLAPIRKPTENRWENGSGTSSCACVITRCSRERIRVTVWSPKSTPRVSVSGLKLMALSIVACTSL